MRYLCTTTTRIKNLSEFTMIPARCFQLKPMLKIILEETIWIKLGLDSLQPRQIRPVRVLIERSLALGRVVDVNVRVEETELARPLFDPLGSLSCKGKHGLVVLGLLPCREQNAR